MDNQFAGLGVALVTPFDNHLEIDYTSLEKLVDHTLKGGVDYLVVQGTTGESATVNAEEKAQLLRSIHEKRRGKPVVFGIGGNNTQHILDQFDYFDPDHYDAILSVCPYYNKPGQNGLINHFSLIADKSPKPVILYNVPGRTAVNLNARSTVILSEHPNIVGIKEASGDFGQCVEIAKNARDDFYLISGDDLLTLPLISIGARGVISVLANALPAEIKAIVKNGLDGKVEAATRTLYALHEISELTFKEGNPTSLKGLLELMNICKMTVRPPLANASEALIGELREAYDILK